MEQHAMISKVMEILDDNCESPSQEMRSVGKALTALADLFEGMSRAQARGIIEAASILADTKKPKVSPPLPPTETKE